MWLQGHQLRESVAQEFQFLLLLLLLETGALYLIPLPKHRLSDTEYRKEEEMSMISNQHPLKPSETRQGSNLKFGLSEH